MKKTSRDAEASATRSILTHWQEAVPNDRLAHLVKDVARALVRALQTRLAQHDVSFGHWAFLRILWERDGLTQRELSDQAGVMEPTTFSAIKAMETLGYVVRRRRPGNRRNVYIHLTPQGQSLKAVLVPLAEAVNAVGTAGLRDSEISVLRGALLAILQNLARDEAQSDGATRRIPVTPRAAADDED